MTTLCWGGPSPPLYIAGRTATSLADGKILLTGGEHEDCGRHETAELYDPSTEKFVAAGEMSRQRNNHSATLLPDGTVLIAGGENGVGFPGTTTTVESYNPSKPQSSLLLMSTPCSSSIRTMSRADAPPSLLKLRRRKVGRAPAAKRLVETFEIVLKPGVMPLRSAE